MGFNRTNYHDTQNLVAVRGGFLYRMSAILVKKYA